MSLITNWKLVKSVQFKSVTSAVPALYILYQANQESLYSKKLFSAKGLAQASVAPHWTGNVAFVSVVHPCFTKASVDFSLLSF